MFLTISLEVGVLKLCGQDHKKEQSYIKGYLHIKNENTTLNTVKKFRSFNPMTLKVYIYIYNPQRIA